jgi:hypothetical protein
MRSVLAGIVRVTQVVKQTNASNLDTQNLDTCEPNLDTNRTDTRRSLSRSTKHAVIEDESTPAASRTRLAIKRGNAAALRSAAPTITKSQAQKSPLARALLES